MGASDLADRSQGCGAAKGNSAGSEAPASESGEEVANLNWKSEERIRQRYIQSEYIAPISEGGEDRLLWLLARSLEALEYHKITDSPYLIEEIRMVLPTVTMTPAEKKYMAMVARENTPTNPIAAGEKYYDGLRDKTVSPADPDEASAALKRLALKCLTPIEKERDDDNSSVHSMGIDSAAGMDAIRGSVEPLLSPPIEKERDDGEELSTDNNIDDIPTYVGSVAANRGVGIAPIEKLIEEWNEVRCVNRPNVEREAPMIQVGDMIAAALRSLAGENEQLKADYKLKDTLHYKVSGHLMDAEAALRSLAGENEWLDDELRRLTAALAAKDEALKAIGEANEDSDEIAIAALVKQALRRQK